jgi:hypothetical protein
MGDHDLSNQMHIDQYVISLFTGFGKVLIFDQLSF